MVLKHLLVTFNNIMFLIFKTGAQNFKLLSGSAEPIKILQLQPLKEFNCNASGEP